MDSQTMNVEIGRRVAEARKLAAEKQETAAKYLNMTRSNYAKKEIGNTAFSAYELAELSKLLNVDCHYLITGIKAVHYDIHEETGLSDKAIERLSWFRKNDSPTAGFLKALDPFISSDGFTELIGCIAIYVEARKSVLSKLNETVCQLEIHEREDLQAFWREMGLSCFRPNQIDNLWLNNARDTFTDILKNELVKGAADDGEH